MRTSMPCRREHGFADDAAGESPIEQLRALPRTATGMYFFFLKRTHKSFASSIN
jgi:hypothetical protein